LLDLIFRNLYSLHRDRSESSSTETTGLNVVELHSVGLSLLSFLVSSSLFSLFLSGEFLLFFHDLAEIFLLNLGLRLLSEGSFSQFLSNHLFTSFLLISLLLSSKLNRLLFGFFLFLLFLGVFKLFLLVLTHFLDRCIGLLNRDSNELSFTTCGFLTSRLRLSLLNFWLRVGFRFLQLVEVSEHLSFLDISLCLFGGKSVSLFLCILGQRSGSWASWHVGNLSLDFNFFFFALAILTLSSFISSHFEIIVGILFRAS
jgi:hypothetical protein